MAGCSEGCGWCGACSEAWESRAFSSPPLFCDECGGDVLYALTCPLGTFCGNDCADKAEAKFTDRMARLGYMPSTFQQRLPELMPGQEK